MKMTLIIAAVLAIGAVGAAIGAGTSISTWTAPLIYAYGGLQGALVASPGGVPYSTYNGGAMAPGQAVAGGPLQAMGGNGKPVTLGWNPDPNIAYTDKTQIHTSGIAVTPQVIGGSSGVTTEVLTVTISGSRAVSCQSRRRIIVTGEYLSVPCVV
jgi:hypothetical protein